MRLRTQDIDLAKSRVNLDHHIRLQEPAWPDRLYRHLCHMLELYGVRIVPKVETSMRRWSALSTAFPNTIRVRHDFFAMDYNIRCVILAHEMVHIRQYRRYGRVRFALGYAFSPRFRWAMEVQAYREGMTVRDHLGMRRTGVEALTERMIELYRLGRIAHDVAEHTPGIIKMEFLS